MKSTSLTKPDDWKGYYRGRPNPSKIPRYLEKILSDEVWSRPPGNVFELGCGLSAFLIESAILGWRVSGIDFNSLAIIQLKDFFSTRGLKYQKLICEDLLSARIDNIDANHDLLISFGVLEHFKHPETVLNKWKRTLKRGGRVLSFVPNLYSINASLLRRYDYGSWIKHIPISPEGLDEIHVKAGLKVIRKGVYSGPFDLNMLIPWGKLNDRWPLAFVRLLRYIGTAVSALSSLINTNLHSKLLSPIIWGLYENN